MEGDNNIPFNNYSIDFFAVFGNWFSGSGGGGGSSFFANVFDTISTVWAVFSILSFIASAILLFGIIYAFIRAAQLEEAEAEFIAESERAYQQLHGTDTKNWRWDEILGRIGSDSPNDWKLAIIEADVMLYEMLESAGYTGTSVGEMLKGASSTSFQTLNAAWEAHKVRNKVAHAGTDFVLTKRLAQDTITQYRQVFEEFGVI